MKTRLLIITGFILFTVGVIAIEVTAQNLSHESKDLSDIPLWIRLVNDMSTYLVFVGIITILSGFIIHRKQNNSGMKDMRK